MFKKLIFKSIVVLAASVTACSAFAWRIDMNFNNGVLGKAAQGSGGFSDAAGGTFFTDTNSYEGGKAVEMNITKGATAFGTWGGIINYPTVLKKGDQIWYRVRTFMPAGFNYNSTSEGNRLKFLRIHTLSASNSNEGYNDWYINPKGSAIADSYIFEGEQVWDDFGAAKYAPVLGTWETYEFYVKFDNVPVSSGGTARVRVWKNGELLKDITNRKTLVSASSFSDRAHMFTYWNGGSPATQKLYVDDIVLTSDTPAAVDAKGNPFVGTGTKTTTTSTPAAASPPAPPVLQIK
ncbi:MAG: hypothetical protein JWM78_3176 [Verrucomicrobiaceae bacterium]|nr:hypothetical protein [Verrucomicrobiaceae bacterium]